MTPHRTSPGVEGRAVQQSAVKVVAHEVSAHHRARAVYGRGDGFGHHQVGRVPHVQQLEVEH